MSATVLARALFALWCGVFCCLGQSYTLQDQAFLGNLISGNQGIQGCSSFTSGLLRYWKVDEGTNTWIKDYVTGNQYAASIVGNSYLWKDDAPFMFESIRLPHSIQVYNYDTYVNCGTGTNLTEFYIISGNYTLSAWAYRLSTVAVAFREPIIEGASAYSTQLHFFFGLTKDNNGVAKFAFTDATLTENGGVNNICYGPTVASFVDSWNLWTATRNGTIWSLYKNGSPVSSVVATGPNKDRDNPCKITIGNTFRPDSLEPRNFSGYIADVRIYNRGLSSNDVWCLYHQYYGRN